MDHRTSRAGQSHCRQSLTEGRTPCLVDPIVLVPLLVLATLLGPGPVAAQDATPVGTSAAMPATPVGEQLAWVLEVLNDGARSLTPADVTARFAPAFLAAAPPEHGDRSHPAGRRRLRPLRLPGVHPPPTATQANALVTGGAGTPLVVPIAVEAADPHRITGLNFVPVPPPPGVQLAPVVDADGTPVAGSDRLDGLVRRRRWPPVLPLLLRHRRPHRRAGVGP